MSDGESGMRVQSLALNDGDVDDQEMSDGESGMRV